MSEYLGVIGGSSYLKSGYFSSEEFVKTIRATPYGRVSAYVNDKDKVVFIQRHAADPEVTYSPPHEINKKAIITAFKNYGCKRILSFNSTGSMKPTLPCGSIVIPDDFLCLTPITFFDDAQGHHMPGYDVDFRAEVIKVMKDAGVDVVTRGSYLQTQGPRFESKSEIRLFATQTDIVGMTSAHEAILCKELGLGYATVCMVDNMANGIEANVPLSLESFHAGVAANLEKMEKLLSTLIASLKPSASASTSASSQLTHVNQMVHARYVLPVAPGTEDKALENHTVVIHDDKIVAVLPRAEAEATYTADIVEDLSAEHVIMPGLINAHTHSGMSLLRGYSDDLALLDWLQNDIWPAEARYMPVGNTEATMDYVRTSVQLAVAEMVKGGTTCINDMYFVPEATAQILQETGFRGVVGFPILDFPNLEAAEAKIKEGMAAFAKYKDVANIRFAVAPHAPYTVGDANLAKCKKIAEDNGLLYHLHLHETDAEVKDSMALNRASPSCHLSDHAMAPLDNLNRMGLLDDSVVAVHMTCMTDAQIDLVAEKKVNVVHCPYSNLKLASGLCPVAELVKRGVNVAIGTDSTGSNNSLDMFAEMKLAACLSKVVASDPSAVPACMALRMATYNGAKTIKMEKELGSVEKGKLADIIAVKLNQIEHLPMVSVSSQLVYTAGRHDVTDVWIGGKRMLTNKTLNCLDETALKAKLIQWEKRIRDDKAKSKSA
jgi:5-methylthioadenosine/S-adenosylhomocysteine deaminase